MGYTHYFPHERVSKSVWTDIVAGCKRACKLSGVRLVHEYDGEDLPPTFNKDDVWFNGVGDDGHETFALHRVGSGGFEFCKTARKPYDLAVTACLLIYKHFSPGTMELSSGGDRKDWQAGKELAERALGLAVEIPETIKDAPAEVLAPAQRGAWTLTFTGVDELTEGDCEHIARLIEEGYTGGEIIHQ